MSVTYSTCLLEDALCDTNESRNKIMHTDVFGTSRMGAEAAPQSNCSAFRTHTRNVSGGLSSKLGAATWEGSVPRVRAVETRRFHVPLQNAGVDLDDNQRTHVFGISGQWGRFSSTCRCDPSTTRDTLRLWSKAQISPGALTGPTFQVLSNLLGRSTQHHDLFARPMRLRSAACTRNVPQFGLCRRQRNHPDCESLPSVDQGELPTSRAPDTDLCNYHDQAHAESWLLVRARTVLCRVQSLRCICRWVVCVSSRTNPDFRTLHGLTQQQNRPSCEQ